MIGPQQQQYNPTKYGQQMEQVKFGDTDQNSYYEKFYKDGKEYYYVSDPMKMRQNKQGSKIEYRVPNLYLAYQQNYPGMDQHVFEASKFFGPQQFQYNGGSYNTSDWANKRLDFGGRSGVAGPNNELINAAKAATPKGYVFGADPYSQGYATYKKDSGNTYDSFFKGLGNLLTVGAAPLTAGLGALTGLSKPISASLVGGLTGSMKNKENPLMGAFAGGLGALMPTGLNKMGITNPMAQGAIGGLTKSLINRDENYLLNALYGGAMGGLGMLTSGAGKPAAEQYKSLAPDGAKPQLGDSKMGFLDSLGSGGGGGLGLNMGGGGGGGAFDAFDDFDFGSGSGLDFSSLAPSNYEGMGGQGLQMGGGTGLQMPDWDWQAGQGISMDSGMGLGRGQFNDFIQGGTGGGMGGGMKELGGALASFGKLLPWKDIVGAGMSAYGNNQAMKRYQNMANQAAERSDPFASQRAQYQQQLSNLMANPNEIMNDPSYKFRMQQGQDAVARMNSARGYNMSGNEMMAMQDYSSNFASQELNNRQNLLAQLAGANFSPGYAGKNYLDGMAASIDPYQQYLASLGLLGRIGMDQASGGQTPPIVGN